MDHLHLHPCVAASLALRSPVAPNGTSRIAITVGEVEFDCDAEFEPAERGSLEDGPGYPAQAHIYAARIVGVDVLGLLDEWVVDRLRDKALEYFCD